MQNSIPRFNLTGLFLSSLLAFGILSGCKKENEKPEELTPNDYAKVPPPTYAQLLKAYDVVIAANPQSATNDSILLHEMVLWIKARPNGELNRVAGTQGIIQIINHADRLTMEEWLVAIANIRKTLSSIKTAGDAENSAGSQFSCNSTSFDNSKLNALQHSYWNALMTKRSGAEFAKKFSTAHESNSPPGDPNTKMDLHNNQFGIDLAVNNPLATEQQLLEMLVREKYVFVPVGQEIPANTKGLVYFVDKALYDGTLTGTMTNPDSGGPWSATFDLTQCDNVIRGQFIIVRGQTTQKRRFSGTIDAAGTIKVAISAPYQFENPGNLVACENMALTLTGTPTSLSGNWTSTNCTRGGTVQINR